MSRVDARVELRKVEPGDIEIFFAHQADYDATAMAAFPSRERDEHAAHWDRVIRNPDCLSRTILYEGEVAGNIGSWTQDGHREVGYWLGKEHWGKGIATEALRQYLALERARPLSGWVARHNVGSARVLEKCGFARAPQSDTDTHLVYELA
jgi:RimJ/RimL family protein N-acetyltransferase